MSTDLSKKFNCYYIIITKFNNETKNPNNPI